MFEVGEIPDHVTGLLHGGLVSDGLLAPRLALMHAFFDRLASRLARDQGIRQDLQPNPGLYALWGRTTEGEVLGLRQVAGGWRLTQVPVPSDLVRRLNLPALIEARDNLVWIEIGPGRVDVLRQGRRFPIWQSGAAGSPQPQPQAPRETMPPDLSSS